MPKKKLKRLHWWQSIREDGRIVSDFGVSPEVLREIVAYILFAFGALLLLAVLGLAGSFGRFLMKEIRLLLGYGSFLLPVALLLLGSWFWKEEERRTKPSNILGLFGTLIFLSAFLHLFVASEAASEVAQRGQAGGVLGNFFASGMRHALGFGGALVLILAFMFICFALTFNTPVKSLFLKLLGRSPQIEGARINKEGTGFFASLREKVGTLFTKSETPKAIVLETEAESPPKEPKEKLWEYPPLELLSDAREIASSGNISKNLEIIQKTLANFGIEIAISDVNIGPSVTQYTFKPAEGIKLAQITARQNDLALALAAKSLRMEAPVPGKSVVGIEIPNKVPAKVSLKQIIITNEFKSAKGNLAMAAGLDVAGAPVVLDLEKMPHLLIAGQTGSGKSVAINSIIVTFLFRNSPDELRFILVDPKRVELTNYNGIPHLLTPVITEPSKTISALKWLVAEMDRRYRLFSEHGKRNIQVYNSSPPDGKRLNYIVCIIDELADLMAASSKEVEGSIVRIAQLARATGIHLILATQRPSVDVITGLIKANIPMRMAFAVASQVDSRTIIDQSGAEKLLGNGDMLIVGNEITKPRRVQGTFVSDKEIEAVINFWKEKSVVHYDENITEFKPQGGLAGSVGTDHTEEDDLYDQAVEVVAQAGKASASLLQRRLKIGYARAARLLDLLEEDGIIGPADGAKPRDVLVSRDQIEL